LARIKANLSQRAAERSYEIPEDDLTPALNWSLYSMRKDWNQVKGQVAPWWAECSKEAYNTGLDQLARALKNWSDYVSSAIVGASRPEQLRENTAAAGRTLDADVMAHIDAASVDDVHGDLVERDPTKIATPFDVMPAWKS
jgi:hypothetical protein